MKSDFCTDRKDNNSCKSMKRLSEQEGDKEVAKFIGVLLIWLETIMYSNESTLGPSKIELPSASKTADTATLFSYTLAFALPVLSSRFGMKGKA